MSRDTPNDDAEAIAKLLEAVAYYGGDALLDASTASERGRSPSCTRVLPLGVQEAGFDQGVFKIRIPSTTVSMSVTSNIQQLLYSHLPPDSSTG